MNLQTLENIAKVHQFNMLQIEVKTGQIKNNELNSNDLYTLVNSMLYDFEDDNSQDNIDQFFVSDSINTATDNLELEIKTFIDFNSLIFKLYNDNNNDLIENENFESNVIEIHEDYDLKTII
ncbi:10707_t:CDS:1 [Cetraspora pellucida]|uniref:10707_t:CDS:1 n=1 Tax=Cetraspora pellucida TaxID=1433469 RepID=A0A9N9CFJ6_9GLOM|nr:10707_t:CDS:1 [Cetraspora pellucida]